MRIHYFLPAILTLWSVVLYAQDATMDGPPEKPGGNAPVTETARIFAVEYNGLNLVDSNIVRSVTESRPKTVLSATKISNDMKKLYKLGFFEDINVLIEDTDPKKITLIFEFKEKPQILRIRIIGATAFDEEEDLPAGEDSIQKQESGIQLVDVNFSEKTLADVMSLKKYNMLDLLKLHRDIEAIKEEYKKKKIFKTHITYKIKPLPDNFVELNITIDESPPSYLTEINVTGTQFFYPIDVVRMMRSAEIDSFSWANQSGIFHEQLINADLYQIYNNYQSEGFIRIKIDKPDIKFIHNKDVSRFIVDINIHEADQYFMGEVEVVSGDTNELIIPKERLSATLRAMKGEPFNPFEISAARVSIDNAYQGFGYAYVSVAAKRTVHEDTKTVDVLFTVYRGEKAYINRIDFKGNLSTQDYVLRRELTIYDNEIYDGNKIRSSRQRLLRLGFFTGSGVTVHRNQIFDRNEIDYEFDLEESFTGTIGGQLSFSESSGVALGLNFSESNFLGRGYLLKANVNFTDKQQKLFSGTFGNNYIWDTKFSSSTSLSYNIDPRDSDYDSEALSLSETLSYPFWFGWNYINRLSASRTSYTKITDVGLEKLDFQRIKDVYSYRTGVLYNTVNHPFKPSSGVEFGVFAEQIGGFLGGDEEYARLDINYREFVPLNESGTMVFMVNFKNSYLFQTSADKKIPSGNRLFLGGIGSIRGFGIDEVAGPSSTSEWKGGFTQAKLKESDVTDDKDDDYSYFITHKGGIESRLLNLELLFPLTREGENIRGVFFYDIGNVYAEKKVYELTNNEKDEWYYRSGYGAGIRLITPAGVIRFEYGNIVSPKKKEPPGQLHFTVSTLF